MGGVKSMMVMFIPVSYSLRQEAACYRVAQGIIVFDEKML